jgi:hypothetical protein
MAIYDRLVFMTVYLITIITDSNLHSRAMCRTLLLVITGDPIVGDFDDMYDYIRNYTIC